MPRDRLILVSLVSWSVATFGTGLSTSVPGFLSWRAAMGLTEALYMPAAVGLIGMLHMGPTRSRALALHGTAQPLGIVLGSWYGGFMADRYDWRLGFWLLSVAGWAYAAALLITFRRLPRTVPVAATVRTGGFDFARSRSYWALAGAFFCFCACLWMLYAWLPSILYERFHLSLATSGLTATLPLQVSSVLGAIGGGFLSDRWAVAFRPARLYVLGLVILAAGPFAFLTLWATSLEAVITFSAIFGLFAGGVVGGIFGGVFDVIPERNYGLGVGAMNMIGGIAGGLGVLFAGQWKDTFGIERVMLFTATAASVSAICVLVVVRAYFESDRQRAALSDRGVHPAAV
jgi:MFS family permease